jgi:hypothetical protein
MGRKELMRGTQVAAGPQRGRQQLQQDQVNDEGLIEKGVMTDSYKTMVVSH